MEEHFSPFRQSQLKIQANAWVIYWGFCFFSVLFMIFRKELRRLQQCVWVVFYCTFCNGAIKLVLCFLRVQYMLNSYIMYTNSILELSVRNNVLCVLSYNKGLSYGATTSLLFTVVFIQSCLIWCLYIKYLSHLLPTGKDANIDFKPSCDTVAIKYNTEELIKMLLSSSHCHQLVSLPHRPCAKIFPLLLHWILPEAAFILRWLLTASDVREMSHSTQVIWCG